jgi:copper(I)-binding protein
MRIRPTGALVVGVMAAALALTGCGAGQLAQTSEQVASVDGANAMVGAISIRDAVIQFRAPQGSSVYPIGGSAPLQMTIVNSGPQADRLVSATSPVATSVQISGKVEIPAGQALLVQGAPTASAAPGTGAPAAPGATATAAPGPTTAPAQPTSPAPTPRPAAEPDAGEASIVLTGLREVIQAGRTYPVVLTFEGAGQVSFNVPVSNPAGPRNAPAE